MRSLVFFAFGLFFGYWFYFARMFFRIMKYEKAVTKAQKEITELSADIDQFIMETRANLTDKQWNEDNL